MRAQRGASSGCWQCCMTCPHPLTIMYESGMPMRPAPTMPGMPPPPMPIPAVAAAAAPPSPAAGAPAAGASAPAAAAAAGLAGGGALAAFSIRDSSSSATLDSISAQQAGKPGLSSPVSCRTGCRYDQAHQPGAACTAGWTNGSGQRQHTRSRRLTSAILSSPHRLLRLAQRVAAGQGQGQGASAAAPVGGLSSASKAACSSAIAGGTQAKPSNMTCGQQAGAGQGRGQGRGEGRDGTHMRCSASLYGRSCRLIHSTRQAAMTPRSACNSGKHGKHTVFREWPMAAGAA